MSTTKTKYFPLLITYLVAIYIAFGWHMSGIYLAATLDLWLISSSLSTFFPIYP